MKKNRYLALTIFLISFLFSNSLYAEEVLKQNISYAYFAGGCFWCLEADFEFYKNKGIIDVISGYSGGLKEVANYQKVATGTTNHLETIKVAYDKNKISYDKLLEIFFDNIDPFDFSGQFCDKGKQYLAGVFYTTKEEKKIILQKINYLKNRLNTNFFNNQESEKQKEKKNIAIKLNKFKNFYPAEEYHQDYYLKNSLKYKIYRLNCGRDKRIAEVKTIKNEKKP